MKRPFCSRRTFLGKAARAGAGWVLMSVVPPWAFGQRMRGRAYRERAFFAMGSVATVSAYGESLAQTDQAINKVIAEFGRIERLLSVFDPASEISRINASAGKEPVAVSVETAGLVVRMSDYAVQTGGAFDATVEPLMRLWGFRDLRRTASPSDREIAATLDVVGMKHVTADARAGTVGLDRRGVRLDSGGWGVGYAVDRAIAILQSEGIESALVNHSGDARAFGVPPDGGAWNAAIPDPRRRDEFIRTLTLENTAISTSADYETFVTLGNARYGHLIDMRTGKPADQVASVSVLAESSLAADVLSTALACGAPGVPEGGRMSAIVVRKDGDEIHTEDLK